MLVYAFKENRWRRQMLEALIRGLEFGLHAEGRHCRCAGTGAIVGSKGVLVAGECLSMEFEGFADEFIDTVCRVSDHFGMTRVVCRLTPIRRARRVDSPINEQARSSASHSDIRRQRCSSPGCRCLILPRSLVLRQSQGG